MKKVLVTGGAGYIGSHTVVELLQNDYEPVIIDNLSNSNEKVIDRIEKITGKRPVFYKQDILDREGLKEIFYKHPDIFAVIHFAGFKAVGESVRMPIEYYHNNIEGTLALVDVMRRHGCHRIIFSSSSTVYGDPKEIPVSEDCPKGICTNPYGWTKWMQEQILTDLHIADKEWEVILLRYFNPIGAHRSGLIGEDPRGIPNNLVPYVAKVAIGKLPEINVFGNDYPTKDGTGIRDYIHVVDLARGHVSALKRFNEKCGVEVYNLGTGVGYSVLDVIHAYEKACGKKLPYVIRDRRPGDIAETYSKCDKAGEVLKWKAEYGIEDMCLDSYRWQSQNPEGYDTE